MTDISRIPEELRQHKGWLLWKLIPAPDPDDKPRKVPFYVDGEPRSGAQGSTEDRARLATFDEACRVLRNGGRWAGLGFATLPDWGIVGLDFDRCLDSEGSILPDAWPEIWPVIEGTYTEVSPSGRGLRAFVKGTVEEDQKDLGSPTVFGFETFHSKGFVTVTGQVLDVCEMLGADETLAVANGALSRICASRFGDRKARASAPQHAPAEDWPRVREALLYTAAGEWTWPEGKEFKRKTWLSQVIFGTHFASGGSEEGRELAWDASVALPGHDSKAEADFDKAWRDADSDREGAKASGDSVCKLARDLGWSDPAFALSADTFDVIVTEATELSPIPFARDKGGSILPTMDNASLALRRPDFCGWRIGHDEFKDDVMLADARSPEGDGWRPMRDADLSRIRIALERGSFKAAPKDLTRDAVVLVADENKFDSAITWLDRVARGWDGRGRAETFLIDYFGAADTPYTRACGRYLWTAFAGRVLDPGCQVDMIVTLTGGQGLRKSSAIGAMVPGHEFAIEVDFSKDEEDTARLMRGALVGEIAELRGLHTKDLDAIKKFVTRRHENWIPKYKEFSTTFPRRLVFVGSVNPSSAGFLGDETGERRWLPVPVVRADVEGIAAAREQLWAEGAALWRAGGVAWRDAEALAAPMHEEFGMSDEWEETVLGWLEGVEGMAGKADGEEESRSRGDAVKGVSVVEIAAGALGYGVRDVNPSVQKRVGAILRKNGFERCRIRVNGAKSNKVWRWVRKSIAAVPTQ